MIDIEGAVSSLGGRSLLWQLAVTVTAYKQTGATSEGHLTRNRKGRIDENRYRQSVRLDE